MLNHTSTATTSFNDPENPTVSESKVSEGKKQPRSLSERLQGTDKKTLLFAGYIFWAMLFVAGGTTAGIILSQKTQIIETTSPTITPSPAPTTDPTLRPTLPPTLPLTLPVASKPPTMPPTLPVPTKPPTMPPTISTDFTEIKSEMWFSDDRNGGYSKENESPIVAILCRGNDCNDKLVYYAPDLSDDLDRSKAKITSAFSDDSDPTFMNCPYDTLVSRISCKDPNCSTINLHCAPLKSSSDYKISAVNFKTQSFYSEETAKNPLDPEYRCPEGYFLSGMECFGPFCDDIALRCVQVLGKTTPDWPKSCGASRNGRFVDVSKEDCVRAGLEVNGKLRDGMLTDGSWDHVPFGCSLQQPSKDIHYNTKVDARKPVGYIPVCTQDPHNKYFLYKASLNKD